MGIFWKTETDRQIEEVQDIAGQINVYLAKIESSLLANNGVNSSNANIVSNYMDCINNLIQKSNFIYGMIPDSKRSRVNVPWMDGRYFHYAMYMMFISTVSKKVEYAFKLYCGL